jgi:hypothetical protein
MKMPLGVLLSGRMERVSKAAGRKRTCGTPGAPDKFHTPSLIQTVLSVLESHQISACALADFTADREFHPALKTFILFSCHT